MTRPGDDPTIIFLHIGKTAGSTLRQVLSRQLPGSQVMVVRALRRPRGETLADFATLPEAERARPRLIMGHTVFGLHELVPRPCTYMTMLRDPVRLVHSQYRYVRRRPRHRHHDDAMRMSLSEYVESGIAIEADNSQTRAVCGDVDTPFGECTEAMLERAIANLDQHFAWVGLTERFAESMVLLGRTFGWPDVRYVSANVARSAPELTADERRLIERLNTLDRRLYEHAAAMFDERVAAIPDYPALLAGFERANRRYRPWGLARHIWPAEAQRRLRHLRSPQSS